jgi:hypothetical protein
VAGVRRRSRHKLEAAAAEVERKISRLLTLVENAHADPVATGRRINELVAERKRLAEALRQQPASMSWSSSQRLPSDTGERSPTSTRR